jgi:hypothetical protein
VKSKSERHTEYPIKDRRFLVFLSLILCACKIKYCFLYKYKIYWKVNGIYCILTNREFANRQWQRQKTNYKIMYIFLCGSQSIHY